MYDSEQFAKTFFYMKRRGVNERIDRVIRRLESDLTEDITAMQHGIWSGIGESTVRYNDIASSIAQEVIKTYNLSLASQKVKTQVIVLQVSIALRFCQGMVESDMELVIGKASTPPAELSCRCTIAIASRLQTLPTFCEISRLMIAISFRLSDD